MKEMENNLPKIDTAAGNKDGLDLAKQFKERPWTIKMIGDDNTHEEFITTVVNFIEYLVVNSRSSNLSFSNLQALFELCVTHAVTSLESKLFFVFLTKENDNSRTRERKYLLDERRRTEVFSKIMCNDQLLDCRRLNYEGFCAWKSLFLNVNSHEGIVRVDQGTRNFTVVDLAKL